MSEYVYEAYGRMWVIRDGRWWETTIDSEPALWEVASERDQAMVAEIKRLRRTLNGIIAADKSRSLPVLGTVSGDGIVVWHDKEAEGE